MYEQAVENIVKHCMRLRGEDRLIIISDEDRIDIGAAIHKGAKEICPAQVYLIEEFTDRPAKELPQKMIDAITDFRPTASIYAATGQEGELQAFRFKLMDMLRVEMKCRHGHMISINKQIMEDGMSKDYTAIYKAVHSLYDILKNAKKMKVTDPHGTDLHVTFSPKLKWRRDDGVPEGPGDWCNLPAGEVFTCPENANGIVVAWEVGDYFSDKYGILEKPLTITIENSFVTNVESENQNLAHELETYLHEHENGNRMGEFAVGCLLGLNKLIGNLLQDEKFPGIHMAFGHPYPEFTGQKDWDAPSHVDVIPLNVTASIDNKPLLKDGTFVAELI